MKPTITRRSLLGAVGAGSIVGLAGCTSEDGQQTPDGSSDGDGTTSGTTTADNTTEATSLQDSATIALSTDLTAGVWEVYGGVMPYYTNLVEPLIWVTDDMELEPWLATDWTATGDQTWEFSIREGVSFHNGEELTAEHVVWSFEQVLNEWSWAPGWLHLETDSVTALDEHTVEFKTTDTFPSFPGTIAHNMVAIQHPDRNRDEGEVIGTGPYTVVDRKNSQYVRAEAFDDYWNGAPLMKKLSFEVIADANTRALALQNHEVDVAYEPPKSKVESLRNNDATNVETALTPAATYVGLNLYKDPVSDVKLRRALNFATSQEKLVSTILSGIGQPAKGPIAKSIFWSAHEKLPEYTQDMEKASALVEESSYDGEALQIYVSNNLVDGQVIAQALQQWYGEIGVTVEINVMEDAAYDDAVRAGEPHLVLTSSGTNSGAADYLIYETFHSEGDVNERLHAEEGTGLYNLGGEVDTLIENGLKTSDSAEKETLYESALQKVMEEAVVVPINYGEYIVGTTNDISSLDLRPIPEMVQWPSLKHTE